MILLLFIWLGLFIQDPLQASLDLWNAEQAAHLLRRAGFGGRPEEIDALAKLGRKAAIESLLNYEKLEFDLPQPTVFWQPSLSGREMRDMPAEERQSYRQFVRSNERVQIENMRAWWLQRMITTPRPLEEKLTLFWHGHFTSGYREVKNAWQMYQQNQTLREFAAGNFAALLKKISRDPAMMIYLDTVNNVKQNPNENYARELMELFTMGEGHYTEQDIREAARAFTGWQVDRKTGEYTFQPGQHDEGKKTFLGQSGNFQGDDIIEIILKQPITAEYLARKMWLFFAAQEPGKDVVQALAKVLRENNYEIKPLLRAMFLSDAFYADAVRFANVKNPVELVVGTYRLLNIQAQDMRALSFVARQLGQELFQPPNVKGWSSGVHWITPATYYNRYNFVQAPLYGTQGRSDKFAENLTQKMQSSAPEDMELAMAEFDPNATQPAFDPQPFLEQNKLASAEEIVAFFIHLLLQRPLPKEKTQLLMDYLSEIEVDWQSEAGKKRIRTFIHLLLSTPEYQLS